MPKWPNTKWWPDKDPDSVLDYGILWEEYLSKSSDTIASSEWIVPDGLIKSLAVWTENKTTVWLQGGEAGQSYKITNRITTAAGRVVDQSVKIFCRKL